MNGVNASGISAASSHALDLEGAGAGAGAGGSAGAGTGTSTLTIQQAEQERQSLQQANFDLKMRIFHLEEKMARLGMAGDAGGAGAAAAGSVSMGAGGVTGGASGALGGMMSHSLAGPGQMNNGNDAAAAAAAAAAIEEEMRHEIVQLKLMLEEKKLELDQRNVLMLKAREMIEELRKNQGYREEAELLEQRLQAANVEAAERQDKLQALTTEYEMLRNTTHALEGRLKERDDELSQARAQEDMLRIRVAEQESALQTLQRTLHDTTQEMERKSQDCEKMQLRLEKEVAEAAAQQSKLEHALEETQSLRSRLQHATERVQSLEGDARAQDTEQQARSETLTRELQSLSQSMQEKGAAWEQETRTLRSRVEDLETELRDTKQRAGAERNESEESIARLRRALEAAEARAEATQTDSDQLQRLDAALAAKTSEFAQLQREHAQTSLRLEEAQKNLQSERIAQHELDALKERFANADQEAKDYREQYTLARQEADEAKDELQQTRQALERTTAHSRNSDVLEAQSLRSLRHAAQHMKQWENSLRLVLDWGDDEASPLLATGATTLAMHDIMGPPTSGTTPVGGGGGSGGRGRLANESPIPSSASAGGTGTTALGADTGATLTATVAEQHAQALEDVMLSVERVNEKMLRLSRARSYLQDTADRLAQSTLARLTQATEETQDVSNRMDRLWDRCNRLRDMFSRDESAMRKSQHDMERFRTEVLREKDDRIASLEADLRKLTDTVTVAEEARAQADADRVLAMQERDAMEADKESLRNQVEQMEDAVTTITGRVDAEQERWGEMETKLHEAEAAVGRLSENNRVLILEIEERRATGRSERAELEALSREREALVGAVDRLRRQVGERDTLIEEYAAQLTSMRQQKAHSDDLLHYAMRMDPEAAAAAARVGSVGEEQPPLPLPAPPQGQQLPLEQHVAPTHGQAPVPAPAPTPAPATTPRQEQGQEQALAPEQLQQRAGADLPPPSAPPPPPAVPATSAASNAAPNAENGGGVTATHTEQVATALAAAYDTRFRRPVRSPPRNFPLSAATTTTTIEHDSTPHSVRYVGTDRDRDLSVIQQTEPQLYDTRYQESATYRQAPGSGPGPRPTPVGSEGPANTSFDTGATLTPQRPQTHDTTGRHDVSALYHDRHAAQSQQPQQYQHQYPNSQRPQYLHQQQQHLQAQHQQQQPHQQQQQSHQQQPQQQRHNASSTDSWTGSVSRPQSERPANAAAMTRLTRIGQDLTRIAARLDELQGAPAPSPAGNAPQGPPVSAPPGGAPRPR